MRTEATLARGRRARGVPMLQPCEASLAAASERAALRLARDASLVPNLFEDAHFGELRKHFDERQIVELVSVISLFG